jgi:parallel beta-helix repeat protein
MKNELLQRSLVFGIMVLFIGTTIVSGFNVNPTVNPNPINRGWLYVGGGGPGNYSSIQSAIDDASLGDTVFVYDDSSPYYEDVTMDKSIRLIGENKETTIINGLYDFQVIDVMADGVIINGFTLRNADIGLYGYTNSSNVSNNIFSCDQAGIVLISSSNNQISDNAIVSGYDAGIVFEYLCNKNVVFDNIIQNTGVGIYFGSCKFSKITGNTIKQSIKYGIWISWSFLNFVNKNNFMGNGCSAYFDNSSFNLWLKNYWDDWSSSHPRPIKGTRYGPLLKKIDPWTTYDWRPALKPYEIT